MHAGTTNELWICEGRSHRNCNRAAAEREYARCRPDPQDETSGKKAYAGWANGLKRLRRFFDLEVNTVVRFRLSLFPTLGCRNSSRLIVDGRTTPVQFQ